MNSRFHMFQEFAVMVYELCTTSAEDLVQWTFQTLDHDRSGAMSTDEFKELCKLVSSSF